MEQGYTRVHVLNDGLPGWERNGFAIAAAPGYKATVTMPAYSPQELQELLQRTPRPFTLVDIRPADEFAEGHIPGAVNIPLAEFARVQTIAKLGSRIVVYCTTGARNYNAYRQLRRMGYTDIYQAVLEEWEAAGLPVETGSGKQ